MQVFLLFPCPDKQWIVPVLISGNDRGVADTKIEPWGCCILGYSNVPIQVICTAKSEMHLFRECVFYHVGYPTLRTPLLTYMLTYIFFIVFPLVVEICFRKDEVAWNNSFTCIYCSVLHWLSRIYIHCVSKMSIFLFFKLLCKKLINFNDFWYVKSWENFTSKLRDLPNSPAHCRQFTLGNQKSHFSTILFMHSSELLKKIKRCTFSWDMV